MKQQKILGIDVGASGIKGAIVDIATGQIISDRFRLETPHPVMPDAVAETFAQVVKHFDWQGVIGCGFPAAMRKGVALTAANIDKAWIGTDVESLFTAATGHPVYALNDADAAGVAEIRYGVGRVENGTILLITIGTGLGSALFINGQLIPNTELGHVYLQGKKNDAEYSTSNAARERKEMSYTAWGEKFNEYLKHLNGLFYPDLIILGGGSSKKYEMFAPCITVPTKVVPAQLLNNAGIVGAAWYAHSKLIKK
ncbi:MAG: ROK family protein [Saprospiraceae bacterium]|nr:ROK family protein [Saprospiraceae bacterium]MBP7699731.1 ROK family protein [Saprospiraceae bacterium]